VTATAKRVLSLMWNCGPPQNENGTLVCAKIR